MSAARRYHAWSTSAALCSAALMSVASESSALAAISVPAIAMSWVMFHRSGRTPVPRWLINSLLIALTLNLFRQILSQDHRPEDSISRLSQYLIGLMVIKLFENRRARDQAQALALGAMAAIGAVMTSVTLGVAAWTGAYLLSALCSIVLFQFVSGEARARGAPLLWDTDDTVEPASADRPWISPLRLVLTGAVAAMLIGGTAVFLVVPRDLGQRMIGAWQAKSGAATTGFSDEVQLGIDGVISESDDIVMEVGLELGGQTVLLPTTQYFRGAVLDQYDRQRGLWKRSSRSGDRTAPSAAAPANRLTEVERKRITQEEKQRQIVQRYLLRNKTTEHLFALWKPVSYTTSSASRITQNPRDSTIRLDTALGPVRYEVTSAPGAIDFEPPTPVRDATFAEGPVRDYAERTLRDQGLERDPTVATSPLDEQRVEALRKHLSQECRYSLELEAPPAGQDPIEWFLLESKRGSCEYFASTLTALCRSVGIDARMVTGYATNEVDESSGVYVVRSRHAHAWVEALVPVRNDSASEVTGPVPLRWKTFDAVPTDSSQTTGAIARLGAAVKRTVERLESLWLNVVISFDGQRQTDILGTRLGPTGWIGSLSARLLTVRGSVTARVIGTLTVFFAVFAAVSGGLFLGRMAVRARAQRPGARARPASTLHAPAREAHRVLARLDRVLRRNGIPRPRWAGPVEHARTVARIDEAAASLAQRVARACYAARFGGSSEADVQREGAHIAEIGARLRASRRRARKAR